MIIGQAVQVGSRTDLKADSAAWPQSAPMAAVAQRRGRASAAREMVLQAPSPCLDEVSRTLVHVESVKR
jgi:hypothetical protein